MMILTNITVKGKIVVGNYAVIKRKMGKTASMSAATQGWLNTINNYAKALPIRRMQITADMFQNNPALQMLNKMKAAGCSETQILAACRAPNSLFRQIIDPQINSIHAVNPMLLKNIPTGWLNHSMFSYYDERRVYFVLSHNNNKNFKVSYMDENGNLLPIDTELVSSTDIKGNLYSQYLWLKAKVFGPGTFSPIKPTAAQKQF